MPPNLILAAVDLGSNSFRLQRARVINNAVHPTESLKETIRLAAGLDADNCLTELAQLRAFECLARFAKHLHGLPSNAVRAVGTNTLRIAKNAAQFIREAERILGFPIETISGQEEARLIYLGVAQNSPFTNEKRLVIDIGGGSTELIIGSGYVPLKLESMYMGCVTYSAKFFGDMKLNDTNTNHAESAAGHELKKIAKEFAAPNWQSAVGCSGTARALADILESNGFSENGITYDGLEKLRRVMIEAGSSDALSLSGLRADRIPVLPGGFAIMMAIFKELKIQHMAISNAALREGIIQDLWKKNGNSI